MKPLLLHEHMRAVKTAQELTAIRRSAALLSSVFGELPRFLQVGVSERRVAENIARVMARLGTEALAFPVIVAFGAGSADVHHWPTSRKLRSNEIVMVDCGAVVRGFCSDCTRTFFFGTPTAMFVRWYERVLAAQARALGRVADGIRARVVDRAARAYLTQFPRGTRFPHGTGHGIGRTVHEWPNLKSMSDDVLRVGMVVTVEPGIYRKGWGGIRIEDMAQVMRGGSEVITRVRKRIEDVIMKR